MLYARIVRGLGVSARCWLPGAGFMHPQVNMKASRFGRGQPQYDREGRDGRAGSTRA